MKQNLFAAFIGLVLAMGLVTALVAYHRTNEHWLEEQHARPTMTKRADVVFEGDTAKFYKPLTSECYCDVPCKCVPCECGCKKEKP